MKIFNNKIIKNNKRHKLIIWLYQEKLKNLGNWGKPNIQ